MLDYRVEWLEYWDSNQFQWTLPWHGSRRDEAVLPKSESDLSWGCLRLATGRCIAFNVDGILVVGENGIFRVLESGVPHLIQDRDVA